MIRKEEVLRKANGRCTVKIEDFAYRVAARVLEILEHEQHYKIPEDTRKQVLEKIRSEVNDILRKAG